VPESERTGATGWAIGAVLALLGALFVLLGEPGAPPLARGDVAPGFDLPLLAGGRLALDSRQGKVTLVNFWATWCKPCEEEMPAMDRLHGMLRHEGFELLAIAVDENRADVAEFQARLGVSFPILLDPKQAISRQYQTTGFPESLLLDRQGRIVERYVGPREWDHPQYVERIRRLMN
jgi:thiol-disulfide isomerase/thioredoxin